MKKIIILFFILLSPVIIAQQNCIGGRLNIFSDNTEPFFLYLNGVLQNNQAKSNLTISNLDQRYYSVKIVFENKTLKDITKNNVSVIGKDGLTFEEASYKIKIDSKTKKTKLSYYSGQLITTAPYFSKEIFVGDQNSSSNQNVMINNGINITINNNKATKTTPDTKFKENKCPEMSNAAFEVAIVNIKKENFDDQKSAIAQNLIANYCLSTNQIAQITKTFSFASNQLKFAKQAYNSCIDIRNYYLIKEVFIFKSDKDDFMDFVNSKNSNSRI